METLKFWTPEEFEIASYRWNFKERKNKQFRGSGSDGGNALYTYNEYGFRGDSPDKSGFKIMSVGCSHTEGIDVNDHQTWPHYLSKLIKRGVDINMGISGRSNDYIVRAIMAHTDKFKPNLVCVMYTYTHKKEYYTSKGKIEPYHPSPWGYFKDSLQGQKEFYYQSSLKNEHDDFQNWYKNHQLITYYLKSKNIPFVWNGTFLKTEYTDENRFDGNYPNFPDINKHANSNENELYAKNLYNYIKEKFEI
jgi:hypothetical protein